MTHVDSPTVAGLEWAPSRMLTIVPSYSPGLVCGQQDPLRKGLPHLGALGDHRLPDKSAARGPIPTIVPAVLFQHGLLDLHGSRAFPLQPRYNPALCDRVHPYRNQPKPVV
jgi:hypothetical protein